MASCYNSGNITFTSAKPESGNYGYDMVGGIVGYLPNITSAATVPTTIRGCYNLGTITASGNNLDTRKGNIVGFGGNGTYANNNNPLTYAGVVNCYYLSDALPNDNGTNVGLDGKIFRFGASAWPVSTDAGWGTGNGETAGGNDYWKSPLPAYGTDYPKLWWEQ